MELGRTTYRAAIAWHSFSDKIRYFSNQVAFKNRLKLLKNDIKNIKFDKGCSVIYNKYVDCYYY
jgi:hypothetical protein